MYILNLVYNIGIYNEFSHCLLYNSSHFSLLLGRVFNVHVCQFWCPTSVVGGSTSHFGLVDIVPLLLISNWWSTLFALRWGGVVGMIADSFLCCKRLLWVMLFVVTISSHLFFFSYFMLVISASPVPIVLLSKGSLVYYFFSLHTCSLILLIHRVCCLFYILLEYTF